MLLPKHPGLDWPGCSHPVLKRGLNGCRCEQTELTMLALRAGAASLGFCSVTPTLFASAVLHDNKLTHTDLKPENILFVNSDYELSYNLEKVTALPRVRGLLLGSWRLWPYWWVGGVGTWPWETQG